MATVQTSGSTKRNTRTGLSAVRDQETSRQQGLAPAYWLSAAIIPLLVAASVPGVLVQSLYHDTPKIIATDRGSDLMTLIVVAPALTISLLFSLRGSFRAQVVWLGLLSWVAYNYATYSFGLQFTTLFVVHVALLSLAVFAIAIVIRRFDLTKVRSAVAAHGAVRYMSLFLFLVAGVFLILWLSDLLPATLTNSIPARLKDLQSTSNPIEVLDLSFVLPLLILAGIRLWQRKANGLVLGGSMLAFMAAVMVAISPGSLIFGDGSFDAIYPVIAAISAVLLAVFVILLGTVKRFKEV